MERIMQIFYGNDFLPYKDKDRTIHYPIVGNTFNGMNNVNELHFYVRDIGGVSNLSWVAIAKLPNGRILYELLTDIRIDHEIEENYVVFNISQIYTQLKGEVYISLNGCRGDVEIETDQETGISTISGEIDDNTVVATGSIKLAINYAPQRPLGFSFGVDQYQNIINKLANKSNVINTIQVVVTLPSDLTYYNDGQLFYCNGTYYELVETSGVKTINIAEQNGLLGGEHALLRYNVSATTQINSMPEDSICLVNYGGKDYLYEDYEHTNVVVYDLVGETLYIYTGQGTDTFGDVISNTNAIKYLKQVGNNNVIYATNNSGEQTTLSYSNSVVANAIVRRNLAGQISVPLTPTDNSHATSKKYVDDKINEFAQNELQTVDTTTYPTLQDFLATTGQEGYIYLYPIDATDLTKGYYRYIWENNAWLSLGITEIDLSDYYTKSQADTLLANKVDKTSDGNKVYGTASNGSQKTFDVDNTVGADGNIARRESGTSQISVPLTPTSNEHASSKKYVDETTSIIFEEKDITNFCEKNGNKLYYSSLDVIASVAGASIYVVKVKENCRYKVSSKMYGQTSGYFLIIYFDEQNNKIGEQFPMALSTTNETIITNKLLNIPNGTHYFYVNVRALNDNSYKPTIIEYSSLIEENENSIKTLNKYNFDNSVPTKKQTDNSIYYFYNNEILRFSDAKITRTEIKYGCEYFVSTECYVGSSGFALVNYFDENNNFISYEYEISNNGLTASIINQKLNIPTNAKYFILNTRSKNVSYELSVIEKKSNIYENKNNIDNLSNILSQIVIKKEIEPDEIFSAYLYYSTTNSFVNVSNGVVHKHNIEQNKDYFVTTSLQAQDSGFPLITYFDNNNQFISYEYMNISGTLTSIQNQKLNIPTNASYFYVNGRATTPVTNVYSCENNSEEKEISILFVGNSLTQDGIAYLPYMLKTYYPNIKFKFYMWYNGGYTLAQQYQKFTNNKACEIFSIANNTSSWTNTTAKMSDILNTYHFDIVCLQEYFNYKSSYTDSDLVDFNNCIAYITQYYAGGNALEFVELFHAPKRDDATNIFNLTKQGNALIMQKTICQDMIANGIAVYRALSTDLDNLGDAGHLSPDGTHTQEGLPCLLQTYVSLLWLLDKLGINKSIYGCSMRMTTDIYNTLNVPGPNLGTGVITGTDAQNLLAQEIAIKTFKEGKYFVNSNLTEYTS